MAQKTAEELKKVFADGKRPTGDDFGDLIDSTHGGGTQTTIVPVSKQIAEAGTNSTGFVSPAGVKAYVDGQKATKGEAEVGVSEDKLMTPLRTKEALTSQVTPLLTTLQNTILGGISTTYDTLQKLLTYLNNTFYTKTQSDALYVKKAETEGTEKNYGGIQRASTSLHRVASNRNKNSYKLASASNSVFRAVRSSLPFPYYKLFKISIGYPHPSAQGVDNTCYDMRLRYTAGFEACLVINYAIDIDSNAQIQVNKFDYHLRWRTQSLFKSPPTTLGHFVYDDGGGVRLSTRKDYSIPTKTNSQSLVYGQVYYVLLVIAGGGLLSLQPSDVFLRMYDGRSLLNVEEVISEDDREAFFYKIPKHRNGTGNSLEKDGNAAAVVFKRIEAGTDTLIT